MNTRARPSLCWHEHGWHGGRDGAHLLRKSAAKWLLMLPGTGYGWVLSMHFMVSTCKRTLKATEMELIVKIYGPFCLT